MSRISDTRTLTRVAAAKLVSAGHRAHAITVDLIYAEIKQGSRTTINDELKLWKDEQAKVNALSAALPDAVSNAMLATWAVAVEHGAKAFDSRREEMESEVATANARAESAEASLAEQLRRVEEITAQLEQSAARELAQRSEIQSLRDAKEAANERAASAERETVTARAEAQARVASLISDHERQISEARAGLTSKEADLRAELTRNTERLEGVQKHVLMQVADAREAQKRAEDQSMKATQRGEKLGVEIELLRAQLAETRATLQGTIAALKAASAESSELKLERDTLKGKLDNTTGQLEAVSQQRDSLSRELSHGQKIVAASARSRQSATNSTKNIKA